LPDFDKVRPTTGIRKSAEWERCIF